MLATPELISEAALMQRLATVVPRYLREVPLYEGNSFGLLQPEGGFDLEALRQLPLITKHEMRRNFPQNFLKDPTDLERLLEQEVVELERTSGTAEDRTSLLLPAGWWARQEAAALCLNPVIAPVLKRFCPARRVTINSPNCSGEICYTGVPSRDERTIRETIFLSLSRFPFLWSEADLARMAAEAAEWRPRFLDVDPVYGVAFALYCERQGIRLPDLEFVVCSYEFVSIVHRLILERVFKVPVFDLYGSTETGHLLIETESGEKRASLETAFLEVIEQDPEGVGELVVTTLTNEFMPLVRYRIGDLVERLDSPYCTRYHVHGRVADSFATKTGRRITTRQIDQCFTGVGGIVHYQLSERSEAPWVLRFIRDGDGPDAGALAQLKSRLCCLLELPQGLFLEATDLLMPEQSGKFRLGYPALKPGQLRSRVRESAAICR